MKGFRDPEIGRGATETFWLLPFGPQEYGQRCGLASLSDLAWKSRMLFSATHTSFGQRFCRHYQTCSVLEDST